MHYYNLVEKTFSFFEKLENLFEITPEWLDFRFNNTSKQSETFEGALQDVFAQK